MRNVLTGVTKTAGPMVASIIRTILAQPDPEHVYAQFDDVVRTLLRSHPKIAGLLRARRTDLLAFAEFPYPHWPQIWYTYPLERVNKEIQRRTDVVGTLPKPAALLRLAGHGSALPGCEVQRRPCAESSSQWRCSAVTHFDGGQESTGATPSLICANRQYAEQGADEQAVRLPRLAP